MNDDKKIFFLFISIFAITGLAYFIIRVKTVKFPKVVSYNLSYAPRKNKRSTLNEKKLNENLEIKIIFPLRGDIVKLPFVISGESRTFENKVNAEIKDSKGNIVWKGAGLSDAAEAGKFGNYSFEAALLENTNSGENLTIEVFEYSTKDGAKINKAAVEVVLNK